MRKLYLSLFVLTASCSTAHPPQASAPEKTPAPATTPAATPTAPSVSAHPTPLAQYETYDQWKAAFVLKAHSRGFDPKWVEAQLAGVRPLDHVNAADSQQPEFSRPASTYIRNAASQARVDGGRTRIAANAHVPAIVSKYGVPSSILGGIWGMESDFGRVQGDIDVVSAYATLAYNGRRRVWAEDQLLYTLTILRDHRIDRARLKGSWAGAMGQTQFLPENYLKLGVDGDGDGVVDIWTSDSDALASAANLLSKAGWKPGQAWAVEAVLPTGFDYYLADNAQKTPAEWAALGVRRADGGYFNPSELAEKVTILLPAGASGPAFFAFPNHYVIRKYNNSTSYALAVGLIADGIEGRSLRTGWPTEQALHIDLRKGSQQALKAAGFDPGPIDGVIGAGTRKALKEWQKANNLPADGYLSYALATRLSGVAK